MIGPHLWQETLVALHSAECAEEPFGNHACFHRVQC